MTIGRCWNCHSVAYDTDDQNRSLEVFYCKFHFGNNLVFCSEKCYDHHNREYHTSIDIT